MISFRYIVPFGKRLETAKILNKTHFLRKLRNRFLNLYSYPCNIPSQMHIALMHVYYSLWFHILYLVCDVCARKCETACVVWRCMWDIGWYEGWRKGWAGKLALFVPWVEEGGCQTWKKSGMFLGSWIITFARSSIIFIKTRWQIFPYMGGQKWKYFKHTYFAKFVCPWIYIYLNIVESTIFLQITLPGLRNTNSVTECDIFH